VSEGASIAGIVPAAARGGGIDGGEGAAWVKYPGGFSSHVSGAIERVVADAQSMPP
jgi:hypothetical protein